MSRYCREDVLRILHLPVRQLVAWEKAGLIAISEEYSFDELVQLRKLRDLVATRISVKSIVRSVDAMQKVSGMTNPLLESVAVRHGSRVAWRQYGALVDPVTRQMAFDFELTASTGLAVVRRRGQDSNQQVSGESQEMFLRAVRLEEVPNRLAEAKEIYETLLELHPGHAAAAINLGTIRYNERDFAGAEAMYRRATESDPEYALAFFDLGNVLDEQQRLDEAIVAYERALKLVPQYADAHYNLALAYERLKEPRKALRHWTSYTQLDPTGPWSNHARGQAKRILASERLAIVTRHGRTMRIA
ncbi:tetratricopeptide repeat protein [Granulicella paludicola]|uniref:tetratricopeptide repeat protein n=1 Tax=Granulicella paludicola TaxID=474951 RepID=UPI0021DF4212|nr:tetratricopeptide repeat protein [Granulicella paludicola]